jgi:hypothetical protein
MQGQQMPCNEYPVQTHVPGHACSSSFQRSDQRTEFVQRAQKTLREVLTAEDAPACVRLALHDAGTYDLATKAGGFDGSIALKWVHLGCPVNHSSCSLPSHTGGRMSQGPSEQTLIGGLNTHERELRYCTTLFPSCLLPLQLRGAGAPREQHPVCHCGQALKGNLLQDAWL